MRLTPAVLHREGPISCGHHISRSQVPSYRHPIEEDHVEGPQDDENRYLHGPDMFPFTSGNMVAPFQRQCDVQAPPRRTREILATTAGVLLVITPIALFVMP